MIPGPSSPPPDFTAKIAEYEAELLRLFPRGSKTSMDAVRRAPLTTLYRYKWLCKRLWALRHGRDLEVDVYVSPRNPRRCWARVLPPKPAESTDTVAEPSAPDLAFELGVPLETVEIAMTRRPASLDPSHLRDWILTVHDTLRSRRLPLPPTEEQHEADQPPAGHPCE